MAVKPFSYREILAASARDYWAHLWLFTKVTLGTLGGAVALVFTSIPAQKLISVYHSEGKLTSLFVLLAGVVGAVLAIAFVLLCFYYWIWIYSICLRITAPHEEPLTLKNTWVPWRLALRTGLAWLVYMCIVFAGFILFIIPGLIWSVRYHFVSYGVLDRSLSIREGLAYSSQITKNVKLHIFFFCGIIAVFSTLIGVIPILGFFIATPFTVLCFTHIYRKLSQAHEDKRATHNAELLVESKNDLYS